MSVPQHQDIAFVYRHYFTQQVIVVGFARANDIARSRGCNDWIHINTINPVTVLDAVVQAKGRKRSNIIRGLGVKP